jgi:hypothetical protein
MRDNPDLDDFMEQTEDKAPAKRRRRRVVKMPRDAIKRRAFRVLAILSDLDSTQRERVLSMASKISAV